MLRQPHTRYNRLFIYYFDRCDLPEIQDKDYIGAWKEDDRAVLFFHRKKDELIRFLCSSTGAKIIYQADLDYQDWEAGTVIQQFMTKKLVVCPVWEDQAGNTQNARERIILDPSVIFGSGFHATTRLCLETLEQVLSTYSDQIESALDLGTGTGLLSLAAVKLGVKNVTAVDHNPLACEVAEKNIVLNGCSTLIDVQQADLMQDFPLHHPYNLVIANLYRGLLLQLFARTEFWCSEMYLLSGFTAGMEDEMLAALPARGVQLLYRENREGWLLWLVRKTSREE
jgi:ribosomal protein L11 methyltransferase